MNADDFSLHIFPATDVPNRTLLFKNNAHEWAAPYKLSDEQYVASENRLFDASAFCRDDCFCVAMLSKVPLKALLESKRLKSATCYRASYLKAEEAATLHDGRSTVSPLSIDAIVYGQCEIYFRNISYISATLPTALSNEARKESRGLVVSVASVFINPAFRRQRLGKIFMTLLKKEIFTQPIYGHTIPNVATLYSDVGTYYEQFGFLPDLNISHFEMMLRPCSDPSDIERIEMTAGGNACWIYHDTNLSDILSAENARQIRGLACGEFYIHLEAKHLAWHWHRSLERQPRSITDPLKLGMYRRNENNFPAEGQTVVEFCLWKFNFSKSQMVILRNTFTDQAFFMRLIQSIARSYKLKSIVWFGPKAASSPAESVRIKAKGDETSIPSFASDCLTSWRCNDLSYWV